MKTLEAKLYPNNSQLSVLNTLLENTRNTYNNALEFKIEVYKLGGISLHQFDLEKIFKTRLDVPFAVAGQLFRRLDVTFERFFKRGGFPRFKAKNRFRTIPLKRYGVDFKIKDSKLSVYPKLGIGLVRLRGLRPFEKAKAGRLIKRASGWYFQMVVESTDKKPVKVKSAIGLDVGLKSFVTDSKGKAVKAPKFLIKSQGKLAVIQRLSAKKVKGSNRRKKQNKLLSKVYEKIANQRKDFLHKLSRDYANKYDLVAVEKLNIKGMVRNRHLSKAISDASWGSFTYMLGYKLKMLGKHLVEVSPYMTSQNCSGCGEVVKKTLSIRTHACTNCGFVADRDHNAAINILKKGLEQSVGENIAIASSVTRRVVKSIVQPTEREGCHSSAKPITDY